MQSDPIGLKSSLNTYAYVDSNPLGSSDKLGQGPNLDLVCEAGAAWLTYQSWKSAMKLPDMSQIDDQLKRIKKRISECDNIETEMKLKQIHDELFYKKLKFIETYLQANKSNAALTSTATGMISTGVCGVVFLLPTP